MRIFTWHIHGHYLYYLSHAPHQFYVPYREDGAIGYAGRTGSFPWGENVIQVAAEEMPGLKLDCILFQQEKNYLLDQYEALSEEQRWLPRIYLEHDPPRRHPTDTRHVVDDPDVLLVHVTNFNRLMWDSGRTPARVIEHGVLTPEGVQYSGELERGIAVVNNLASRGRRLGADVFEAVREQVPLDLVGMGSEKLGGLGEIPPAKLAGFEARYRFFFNPIRYTSLGLAVCEAMMLGMPIVGLATTEMATTIQNGVSGFVSNDPERLVEVMRCLLANSAEARRLGEGARQQAMERFNIDRFVRDWNDAFAVATLTRPARVGARVAARMEEAG